MDNKDKMKKEAQKDLGSRHYKPPKETECAMGKEYFNFVLDTNFVKNVCRSN